MDKPGRSYIYRLKKARRRFFEKGSLVSLADILQRLETAYSGRDCIVERVKNKNVVHTADEFCSDIRALSAYLLKNGLNGNAALVSENSYSWLVSFFAVTCSGFVCVPLDRELPDAALVSLSKKADCTCFLFSRTYKKAAEAFCAEKNFESLCINGESFENALSEGKHLLKNGFQALQLSKIKGDDPAAIVFTSGTTGANKGVLLSHKNLVSSVQGVLSVIEPVYSALSVLPMNHTYELSCCVLSALCLGAVLYINDSFRHFQRNLSEFQPEGMAAVPLIPDNIYETIIKQASEKGKLDFLMKSISFSNFLRRFGIDLRKLIFRDIMKSFGYRFPMMAVGGAPVNAQRMSFLSSVGFNIYVGYGLTEASPIVAINSDIFHFPDSVGKCVGDTECKIVEPDCSGVGEIAIRGSNITKGYYKDENATAASFKDGWFLTGDYGRLDQNGRLYISGRKKNLIILDNGKNICPEVLEDFFRENSPLFSEAVVFERTKTRGKESAKLLVLAVSIDREYSRGKSEEQLREEAFTEVYRLNRLLPSYERIADVMAVTHEFEKTSTLKIIRRSVEAEYEKYEKHKEEEYV